MTAAEHMAFKKDISGSLYVSENRKYRRNCAVTGFLRHSYTDRVRIQDRVLIEVKFTNQFKKDLKLAKKLNKNLDKRIY